jgi:hypothetical protein
MELIRNRKVIGSTPIAGSIQTQSFTAISVDGCFGFVQPSSEQHGSTTLTRLANNIDLPKGK